MSNEVPAPTLFDAESAARDAGAAAAEDAAGVWATEAFAALVALADRRIAFTSEDVRAVVGDPVRANAMGAIFLRAKRRRIIVKISERPATRAGMHRTMLAVYAGR